MHDGTKVRASAGADTFRREQRLRAHLELARKQVEEMGDPCSEELSKRVNAARKRAVREREQRLQKALEELEQIRAAKSDQEAKQEARASMTDPEARVMKQPEGGYAPSYNVQVSTDSAAGVIVGVGVTQLGSDYRELVPGVERVEANLGRAPEQLVVDGGFTSRENILSLNQKKIDLVGALEERTAQSAAQMERRGISPEFYPAAFTYDAAGDVYTCPAGKTMCCDRKPEGTSHRADRSRLPSVRGGLPGVLLQRSLLSEDVRQRAHDQPTRRGHSGGHLHGEDGDRPGQGDLPPARGSSGILQPVDQGQARTAAVPPAGARENWDRGGVGLPDLQCRCGSDCVGGRSGQRSS